ncbi:MAG: hypothetical protein P8I82_05825 [Flavobacteriales bacterium]|nr:hypothetical protein [Flavobacteriales bacterium]
MSKFNVHIDLSALVSLYGGSFSATVNLERHLISSYSGKTNLYARGGLGYAGALAIAPGAAFGVLGKGGLGALTLLTGSNKHHFELVCGAFMGISDVSTSKDTFILPVVDVGYRYQKPGTSFIFRSKVGFLGLGIGLGHAF